MSNLKYSTLILVLLALALTGCKQQPADLPIISPQARSRILSQINNWRADGRAAIRNKDQGHNVSMEWQQNGQHYNLYFYGPFSAGSIRIIGQPGHVTLTTSEGKTYESASPENLVMEHLGWDLPFAGLHYWIKGIQTPDSAPRLKKLDSYNQLQTLEQDGWTIEYQNYRVYDDISLPERINLSNSDLKLKIIIHKWQKQ